MIYAKFGQNFGLLDSPPKQVDPASSVSTVGDVPISVEIRGAGIAGC